MKGRTWEVGIDSPKLERTLRLGGGCDPPSGYGMGGPTSTMNYVCPPDHLDMSRPVVQKQIFGLFEDAELGT
jgi:hypothetical protein